MTLFSKLLAASLPFASLLLMSAAPAVADDAVKPLLPEVPPLIMNLPGGGTVQAFGTVDMDVSYFNHVSNATNTGSQGSIVRAESGTLTVSELGLKGSQPLPSFLGANTKMTWDVEPGFDVANLKVFNNNSFLSRDAWVGLSSDLVGTARYGRQWNFNDDYLNASYYLPGYRLSVFRLTEFGELSNIHDDVVKYVTPSFKGLQAGAYIELHGDDGVMNKVKVYEGMLHYTNGPFSATAVYDTQSDYTGKVISQMPSFGASYTFGNAWRVRGALAFNTLYPGLSAYPGGAGPIMVPYKTQVDLYVAGLDWSPTNRLTISGDFAYRDDVTARNNTQIYRLLADYIINRNIDVYSQIGFEQNHGGAEESFYSAGASSYLGSGYPNQNQFAVMNGFRFKF